jgi:NAD(P)-dependent dehydrogenase (short-subunit alcohol dehydrogenase family)
MTTQRFADTTALVTGAGSGLGAATARRLAAEGAAVACLDVMDAAAETAAAIRASGARAQAYLADVSDAGAVREAVGASARDLGRPAVVVNCAGIGRFYHSHDMPPAEWLRIIAVNLTGTFFVCQAALPFLLEGGGALTRSLADEYLERGIRVNCIAPGGITTPLQDAFRNVPEGIEWKKLIKIRTPLGNATPEEVAALICFVASPEGRYMTGAVVSIDGGLTM